jgi:uncharacterized protein (DUF433 family)
LDELAAEQAELEKEAERMARKVHRGLVRRLLQWQGGDAMKTDLLKRITVEPGKCGGRPCIRGMRIRVTDILQLLSAGAPYEEILEDYPDLQRDDILAAIEYAAHMTDHVVLHGV